MKPLPVSVAALTVTGAVPVEVKVTECVTAVFTVILPNVRLVVLMLSVGTAAFNCRTTLLETPPSLASNVTVSGFVTHDTIAVKLALVAFAGTVTVAGTFTAVPLLDRFTLNPPLGAAALNVTVQTSVADPVIDPLLQESPLSAAAAASPVPLSPITALLFTEESLSIVNRPVAPP